MIGRDNQSNRDAWVRAQLAAIPAGWLILDVGAGRQPYRDACAHLRYLAMDAEYQPGINIVMCVGRLLDVDISADAILCTEVLEHVPHPDTAIWDMAQKLKPGGRLILTAPFACRQHMGSFYRSGFAPAWYHNCMDDDFEDIRIFANGDRAAVLAQELWQLPKWAWPFAAVCMLAGLRWRGDVSTCYGYFVTARRRHG